MKQCLLLVSFLMSSASFAKTTTANPGTPELFQAMAVNSNRVKLSWIDTSSNETHFKITSETTSCYDDPDLPSGTTCSLFSKRFTVPADSTTYIDTEALAGMRMKYQISACKGNECTPWNHLFVELPVGHHKVSGKVVDSDFNPLDGVVVQIGSLYKTTTDANGFYSFTDIPTQMYWVRASKTFYSFEYRNLDLRKDAVRQHFQSGI